MTFGFVARSRRTASAGGQEEQPWDVNSSTTTGRVSASAGVTKDKVAIAHRIGQDLDKT